MTAIRTPSATPGAKAGGPEPAQAGMTGAHTGAHAVPDTVADPDPGSQVWRCSRGTLMIVTILMVIVGLAIPAAAAVSLVAGVTAFGGQQIPVLAIICGLAVVVLVFGWRLGLHPRLVRSGEDVEVINPFHRQRFDLADVTLIKPGGDGLLIATPQAEAEAWCVQKSTTATRSGRQTRADRVSDELRRAWDRYHLPDQDPNSPVRLRFARPGEEGLLTGLEQSASLARLGHIFPPEQHPYPAEEVYRRWQAVLDDRTRLTLLAEVGGEPAGYACYGQEIIHHLGVAEPFQRHGVGTTLLSAAEDELFADLSTTEIGLWVLEANHTARAFYTRLGWAETGETRTAEFPPYPPETRMSHRNPHLARRGR